MVTEIKRHQSVDISEKMAKTEIFRYRNNIIGSVYITRVAINRIYRLWTLQRILMNLNEFNNNDIHLIYCASEIHTEYVWDIAEKIHYAYVNNIMLVTALTTRLV